MDLAHSADRQFSLEAKITAQDQSFIFRGSRTAGRDRGLLGDLQGIDGRVRRNRLSLEQVASGQMSKSYLQTFAKLGRQFSQGFTVSIAGDAQKDHKVIGFFNSGSRLRGKIGRDLNVLQVVPESGQRRRDACQSARMVLADDQNLKGVQCQGSDLDIDRRVALHPGQQPQMAGNVRGRITLEVRGRQSAKMPLQQGRLQIAAVMANGLQQVNHSWLPIIQPRGWSRAKLAPWLKLNHAYSERIVQMFQGSLASSLFLNSPHSGHRPGESVCWEWKCGHNIDKPLQWQEAGWDGPEQPIAGVSWYEAEAYARFSNDTATT